MQRPGHFLPGTTRPISSTGAERLASMRLIFLSRRIWVSLKARDTCRKLVIKFKAFVLLG